MKRAITVIVCMVLGGCITVYKPPVGESLPTFEVDITHINVFDFYNDGTDCSKKRGLPKQYSPHVKGSRPFPIRANEEISFKPSYVVGLSICTGVFSFTSKPNHNYLLYNTLAKDSDGEEVCHFTVLQKSRLYADAKWEPVESFKKRERTKGFTHESAHCEVLKK